MPLYLICQCCKCGHSESYSLWSISSDHKYSYFRYFCQHFNVDLDHESSTGFFGIKWWNKITIRAEYKPTGQRQTIISKTFSRGDTEYENYKVFNKKVVFEARISDYKGQYPNNGTNKQKDIEYDEEREQERLNQLRLERERQEKLRRELEQKELEEKCKTIEEKRKNDLILLKKKRNKKLNTTSLLLKKKTIIEFKYSKELKCDTEYLISKN